MGDIRRSWLSAKIIQSFQAIVFQNHFKTASYQMKYAYHFMAIQSLII